MKIDVSIADGKVTIDLIRLIMEHLSEEDQTSIAELLVLQPHIMNAAVGLLVNDMTPRHSYWTASTGHDPLEDFRLRVIESIDSVTFRAVQKIVQDRDEAEKSQRRYRDWAWKMYHYIRDRFGHVDGLPEADPFVPTDMRTEGDIDAVIRSAKETG